MTPPEFPLLLIVPAVLLDLLWQRTSGRRWMQAVLSGTLFLAVLMAVQWPFATFLMSPAARNWFFGAQYFGYYASPASLYVRNLFLPSENGAALWNELAWALGTSIVMTRLGLAAGNWMRRIRR
jgi:hypothetical protein